MRQLRAAFFLFLFCAFPVAVQAKTFEGVLSYDSDIRIQSDGNLLITDTIRVNALQNDIRHGIYRSFPLLYRDNIGKQGRIGFLLVGVSHNGQPAPYRIRSDGKSRHLSIGEKDTMLQAGIHEYRIIYHIRRAVDFSGAEDRLRWNVTGTGWDIPLQRAAAHLHPPEGAVLKNYDINGDVEIDKDGVLHSRSIDDVLAKEGLIINAAWPKNFLTPPTDMDRLGMYIEENYWSFTAFAVTGFALMFFFVIWWLVGRDPPRGTVIPEFAPPENFSPALAAYVAGQGSGEATLYRAFCAAIAALAVKGFIKITLHTKNRYALDLVKPHTRLNLLPAAERVLAKCLFAGRTRRFIFAPQKDIRFEMILSGFGNTLKRKSDGIYFAGNEKYVLASTVTAVFLSVWLFTGMLYDHILLWQGAGMIIGLLSLNLVYYFLMKAPTRRGRWKMDRLEGFKMYLSVAEKDRMDFTKPTAMTPELFEAFLPYAVAFDIEKNWSEKFKKSVPKPVYDDYRPQWFLNEAAQLPLQKICLKIGAGMQNVLVTAAQLPGQITAGKAMKKAAIMKAGGGLGSGTGGGW